MLAPLRHDDDGRRNSCCPAVRGHGAQAYPGWPRSRYAAQCMGLRMTMCDNRLHPRDGCGHGACMAYFTKRYHPPGTPPGTLIEHPAPQAGPLRLHLIDYTAEGVSEQDDVTLTQCKVSLERDDITWIHARGNITAEVLRELGEAIGLHPLALEDVLNHGQRTKLEIFDHQLYLIMRLKVWRDCYELTVQIMDLFETYRDMAASMLDVYLSSASQRLNEIKRVLTVITTLFIPPTFLVNENGMNFDNPRSPWAMPELHSYYGYPIVWLVIIAMIAGMLVFFKRRGWF